LEEIRDNGDEDSVIFLVGNRCDLDEEAGREVTKEMVQDFLEKFSIKYYHETSAKTGENVEKLFREIA
jgi:Ras-related protein Rab-2A